MLFQSMSRLVHKKHDLFETVTHDAQTSIRSLGENVIISAKQESRDKIRGINLCKLCGRDSRLTCLALRELQENSIKERNETQVGLNVNDYTKIVIV